VFGCPSMVETPRGLPSPQDWTVSRSTVSPRWVEMKEKIAYHWQLPSWVCLPGKSQQGPSKAAAKQLSLCQKTDFGLPGWGRALVSRHCSLAAGDLWQACSDQRKETSHLPGNLLMNILPLSEPQRLCRGSEDDHFRPACLKCFDGLVLETG
jgi:hypothetical protein